MERETYVYRPHFGYQLLVWGVGALLLGSGGYLIQYGMESYGGAVFIFMGIMILAAAGIVLYSTSKSYCRIELGTNGMMLGRTLYPWESVTNNGDYSEKRELQVMHFVTVAERNDEFVLFKLNSREKTRWFKLYKRLYPEYMKIQVQIELFTRQ